MPRLLPETTGWRDAAVLRPGLAVRVLDIGPLGALLESEVRLRPGVRTQLHLTASHAGSRMVVAGRLGRCHVCRLEPLRYRGSIEFDRMVELLELQLG